MSLYFFFFSLVPTCCRIKTSRFVPMQSTAPGLGLLSLIWHRVLLLNLLFIGCHENSSMIQIFFVSDCSQDGPHLRCAA
ncbi:hypothetical protein ARMGADRAFT_294524 [Armillaria gallica]|uniref:Uncharacterized protein n=1 Tax=Armillaria gallica TaxID=47427 RepID=A0A2H3DRC8_ARMGA|nr:hypothetical protein ARMGADRAFT_294524 [Armillaria gallica]